MASLNKLFPPYGFLFLWNLYWVWIYTDFRELENILRTYTNLMHSVFIMWWLVWRPCLILFIYFSISFTCPVVCHTLFKLLFLFENLFPSQHSCANLASFTALSYSVISYNYMMACISSGNICKNFNNLILLRAYESLIESCTSCTSMFSLWAKWVMDSQMH